MFCNMDEGSAPTEFQEANSAPLPGFDSFTAISMDFGFMGPLSMRTSSTEAASPLEPNDLCPGNSSQNYMDSSSRGSLPSFKDEAPVVLVTEPNNLCSSYLSPNSLDHSSNKAPVVLPLPATAKKNTFQKYKKRQFCLFCQKPYFKLSRHLKNAHKNERDVALAYSFDKGSKQRKFVLGSLMKKGNFSHNASVESSGVGELVPCRRGTKNPNDLVHCKFCLGLYAKNHLWRHVKNIHTEKYVKKKKQRHATVNKEASLLLFGDSFYNPFAQDDMNVGDNGAGSDLEKLIEGSFDTTCLRETLEATHSETNGSFDETCLGEISESTKDININDSQNDASLPKNTSEATASKSLNCSAQKKKGKKMKRRWTGEEVAAVQRHMTDFITRCRVPGRKICDQCLRSEPEALKQRDWLDIKNFVHNRIMASKKKTR